MKKVKAVSQYVETAFYCTLALLFVGCSANVYLPNAAPSALLKKEKEIHFAGYTGTNGVDFTGSYSLTEHFAIAGGYTSEDVSKASEGISLGDNSGTNYKDKERHRYSELMLGYYMWYNEDYTFEAFGGYGTGHGSAITWYGDQPFSNYVYAKQASAEYERYTTQFVFGRAKPSYQGGGILRCSFINFTDYRKEKPLGENIETAPFNSFLFEPIIFGRAGGGNIFVEAQIIATMRVGAHEFDYPIISAMIGLHLMLDFNK